MPLHWGLGLQHESGGGGGDTIQFITIGIFLFFTRNRKHVSCKEKVTFHKNVMFSCFPSRVSEKDPQRPQAPHLATVDTRLSY